MLNPAEGQDQEAGVVGQEADVSTARLRLSKKAAAILHLNQLSSFCGTLYLPEGHKNDENMGSNEQRTGMPLTGHYCDFFFRGPIKAAPRGIRDASICLKFFVLLRRKKIHTPKHVLLEREWRG
jgi:hypothetical protein